MKVSACLKLASSALLMGTTAGRDRLRRTQTRGGSTQSSTVPNPWAFLPEIERDIGTALANAGVFAVRPNATTNSTMPGGMANSTMPGMVNSTMPGSMDNTTMPGSMANTTTTTTNVTRRGQTVGAVNHSSEPMSFGGARNATTNSTEAAGNTTMPGLANNTMPAGTGAMPAPTRANSTTVGGRNVSGSGGFHRMLRAMDYASSIANATATNGPLHVSANSTAHAAASAANSTTVNSTMPGGMANTTTNSTAPAMPPTTTRFLMDMMANATMPMGSMGNATMPMGTNTSVPMSNSSMPMSNTTTNATTMGGVGSTTRFLTYGVRAMANATMPGMMNSTMPMGSHNATTNSTMPAGMGNATMPMGTNTTTVGGASN